MNAGRVVMSENRTMARDNEFMQLALAQAALAAAQNEVPVGAIIVKENRVIASGFNQPISTHDPSAHAEMVALRSAGCTLNNYRLIDTTLYVTLEPCVMCIGAIIHARVKRVVYGARDPKAGAVESVFQIADESRLNHSVEYEGGVLAEQCADKLRQFFKSRR